MGKTDEKFVVVSIKKSTIKSFLKLCETFAFESAVAETVPSSRPTTVELESGELGIAAGTPLLVDDVVDFVEFPDEELGSI